ncbi:hypothetical protein BLOT_002643 [Blomia tropicalis]|nr:hypothetical protein BLOT_002643 [Blomia tropicalis]
MYFPFLFSPYSMGFMVPERSFYPPCVFKDICFCVKSLYGIKSLKIKCQRVASYNFTCTNTVGSTSESI